MRYDVMGHRILEYEQCKFSGSRLQFRGPKPALDRPYMAFLGGTETFGKFIETPFAQRVAQHVPARAVNLGLLNGGIDAYLNDPGALEIAKRADLTVLQVMGAVNLSNRFFRVHPRRNDRFIAPEPTLTALFPEVDFAQFHFTNAMFSALKQASDKKYQMVCRELQDIWLARMTVLLRLLGGKTVLLWLARQAPPKEAMRAPQDPMLIDAEMIARVRKKAASYVEVVPSKTALDTGTKGMVFSPLDAPSAELMLGPAVHEEVALALQEVCTHLLT